MFADNAIGFFLALDSTPFDLASARSETRYKKFVATIDALNKKLHSSYSKSMTGIGELVGSMATVADDVSEKYKAALDKLSTSAKPFKVAVSFKTKDGITAMRDKLASIKLKAINQPLELTLTKTSTKAIRRVVSDAVSSALSKVSFSMTPDGKGKAGKSGKLSLPDYVGQFDIPHFATGGPVNNGPSKVPTRQAKSSVDNVLAWINKGEYVIPADVTKHLQQMGAQLHDVQGKFADPKPFTTQLANVQNLGNQADKLKGMHETLGDPKMLEDHGKTVAVLREEYAKLVDEFKKLSPKSQAAAWTVYEKELTKSKGVIDKVDAAILATKKAHTISLPVLKNMSAATKVLTTTTAAQTAASKTLVTNTTAATTAMKQGVQPANQLGQAITGVGKAATETGKDIHDIDKKVSFLATMTALHGLHEGWDALRNSLVGVQTKEGFGSLISSINNMKHNLPDDAELVKRLKQDASDAASAVGVMPQRMGEAYEELNKVGYKNADDLKNFGKIVAVVSDLQKVPIDSLTSMIQNLNWNIGVGQDTITEMFDTVGKRASQFEHSMNFEDAIKGIKDMADSTTSYFTYLMKNSSKDIQKNMLDSINVAQEVLTQQLKGNSEDANKIIERVFEKSVDAQSDIQKLFGRSQADVQKMFMEGHADEALAALQKQAAQFGNQNNPLGAQLLGEHLKISGDNLSLLWSKSINLADRAKQVGGVKAGADPLAEMVKRNTDTKTTFEKYMTQAVNMAGKLSIGGINLVDVLDKMNDLNPEFLRAGAYLVQAGGKAVWATGKFALLLPVNMVKGVASITWSIGKMGASLVSTGISAAGTATKLGIMAGAGTIKAVSGLSAGLAELAINAAEAVLKLAGLKGAEGVADAARGGVRLGNKAVQGGASKIGGLAGFFGAGGGKAVAGEAKVAEAALGDVAGALTDVGAAEAGVAEATAGGGAGVGVGGFLTGLATGIAAFAAPPVAIGVAVLTASVAAIILATGGALAITGADNLRAIGGAVADVAKVFTDLVKFGIDEVFKTVTHAIDSSVDMVKMLVQLPPGQLMATGKGMAVFGVGLLSFATSLAAVAVLNLTGVGLIGAVGARSTVSSMIDMADMIDKKMTAGKTSAMTNSIPKLKALTAFAWEMSKLEGMHAGLIITAIADRVLSIVHFVFNPKMKSVNDAIAKNVDDYAKMATKIASSGALASVNPQLLESIGPKVSALMGFTWDIAKIEGANTFMDVLDLVNTVANGINKIVNWVFSKEWHESYQNINDHVDGYAKMAMQIATNGSLNALDEKKLEAASPKVAALMQFTWNVAKAMGASVLVEAAAIVNDIVNDVRYIITLGNSLDTDVVNAIASLSRIANAMSNDPDIAQLDASKMQAATDKLTVLSSVVAAIRGLVSTDSGAAWSDIWNRFSNFIAQAATVFGTDKYENMKKAFTGINDFVAQVAGVTLDGATQNTLNRVNMLKDTLTASKAVIDQYEGLADVFKNMPNDPTTIKAPTMLFDFRGVDDAHAGQLKAFDTMATTADETLKRYSSVIDDYRSAVDKLSSSPIGKPVNIDVSKMLNVTVSDALLPVELNTALNELNQVKDIFEAYQTVLDEYQKITSNPANQNINFDSLIPLVKASQTLTTTLKVEPPSAADLRTTAQASITTSSEDVGTHDRLDKMIAILLAQQTGGKPAAPTAGSSFDGPSKPGVSATLARGQQL